MHFTDLLMTIGLVMLGTVAHVLKMIVEARESDSDFGIREYFGLYPYRTALMVLTALGTSVGLFYAGELTPVTAFATGFMSQSIGRAAGNR